MVSTARRPAEAEGDPIGAGHFHFITIQAPGAAANQATKRQARSHAVKQALANKRKLQQNSGDNFRVTTSKGSSRKLVTKRRSRDGTPAPSPFSLSAGAIDPFQTLPVDSSRLQILLGNHKARQAPEPVFSVAAGLKFHSFSSVFRTGLADPALLNAVMLSLEFAVTGGSINRECLGYQGLAISYIRERMSSVDEATSEATIGAILLLAGVEARLGMTSQVQLHMGAVQLLLKLCQAGARLTSGIKRAIFWQDLNSSVLAGSSRIFSHTTFAELHWTRETFHPSFFELPPGFQTRSHLFTKDFIEVLEDVQALKCIRDMPGSPKDEILHMSGVNNHTASIQSRLVGLPNLSSVLTCCHLAAYICSVMLCCTIWCPLVIPSHMSTQLLRQLQEAKDDPIWNEHPDLLLWLLCIGGAFAPTGDIRSGYIAMLRSNDIARFGDRPWLETLEVLKEFTWSERAFRLPVKVLWEETWGVK